MTWLTFSPEAASVTMKLASAAPERAHLSPKPVRAATAECRVGVSRQDITPPVGVYNRSLEYRFPQQRISCTSVIVTYTHRRSWGAAKCDVATGIHKKLFVSALAVRNVVYIRGSTCLYRCKQNICPLLYVNKI